MFLEGVAGDRRTLTENGNKNRGIIGFWGSSSDVVQEDK